jgi:mannan endo-1,6-alpha-mannosidase
MSYYTGNRTGDTPGNLPDPYYWWECGAMFGAMINYWYYTGDTSYNAATSQALLHQAGDTGDYMPDNQTRTEGNDDQGFWGMAAMTAAETKFPDPPAGNFGWLALAQGVFNTQVARWDNTTCGGGFRWQIFTFNTGYNYKNTISNGCVFNLAARLALYTGDTKYADWAEKIFDWVIGIGLMSPEYHIYDGTTNTDNCSTQDHNLWTYNAGIYLMGSAAMYNYTNGSAKWEARVSNILNASSVFFQDNVMYEPCEGGKCNVDQRSFKAYFSRWLATTTQLAPFTSAQIMTLLATSAAAAVKTCTGGTSGNACGLRWTTGAHDGSVGVGEQMAVLEVVQGNLVGSAPAWVSDIAGTGTSQGDPEAGSSDGDESRIAVTPITGADRAGAGIVTAIILMGVVAGSITMTLS